MNKTTELNALRDRIHAGNKLWWTDLTTDKPIKRDRRELLMLAVSEVAEAMEGQVILLTEENARLQEYVAALKERIRSMVATQYKLESGFDCP